MIGIQCLRYGIECDAMHNGRDASMDCSALWIEGVGERHRLHIRAYKSYTKIVLQYYTATCTVISICLDFGTLYSTLHKVRYGYVRLYRSTLYAPTALLYDPCKVGFLYQLELRYSIQYTVTSEEEKYRNNDLASHCDATVTLTLTDGTHIF